MKKFIAVWLAVAILAASLAAWAAEDGAEPERVTADTAEGRESAPRAIADTVEGRESAPRAIADAAEDTRTKTSYPTGGMQVQETFAGGYRDGAFQIGTCLRQEDDKDNHLDEILSGFEGITVNNSTTVNTHFNYAVEGSSAVLYLDYDIKFEDLVSSGSTLAVNLSSTDAADATPATTVMFNGAEKDITVINKSGGTYVSAKDLLGELEDGRWYHVRDVITVTDGNLQFTPRHTVSINGIVCWRDYAFQSTSYQKFCRLNRFYVRKYVNEAAKGTTYYIDNISVCKTNVNYTTAPEDFGAYLTAVRDAERVFQNATAGTQVGEYDPELYQRVGAVIEEAKAAYNRPEQTPAALVPYINRLTAVLEDFLPNKEPIYIGTPSVKYKNGDREVAIGFAREAVIEIPVAISKYAPTEGADLTAIVAMYGAEDADGDPIFQTLATGGRVHYQQAENGTMQVTVDISGYSLTEKRALTFRVMVWNGFTEARPYLIPAAAL